jgi:hypothetical protein
MRRSREGVVGAPQAALASSGRPRDNNREAQASRGSPVKDSGIMKSEGTMRPAMTWLMDFLKR